MHTELDNVSAITLRVYGDRIGDSEEPLVGAGKDLWRSAVQSVNIMRRVDDLPAPLLPTLPENRIDRREQCPLEMKNACWTRTELTVETHEIEWIGNRLDPPTN